MPSANRTLEIFLSPVLTFPLSSFRTSEIIRSRKMLKNVSDRRHHCFTPTNVLNHFPILPFIWTAFVVAQWCELYFPCHQRLYILRQSLSSKQNWTSCGSTKDMTYQRFIDSFISEIQLTGSNDKKIKC